MNKHEEAKWQGKSICEDDIELIDTIIHKNDVVTGYLVYNDKQPYIVGDLVEVNESETALEYWIPVSETSLKNLSYEATEKELEIYKKLHQKYQYLNENTNDYDLNVDEVTTIHDEIYELEEKLFLKAGNE